MSELFDEELTPNNSDLSDPKYITEADLKKYTVNTLLEKAGGFGRMQWLLIMYSSFATQGINYFFFNFAYLELVPLIE